MRKSLMLLALVFMTGCPEPVPTPSSATDAPPTPPADGAPPPGAGTPSEDIKVTPGTGVVISGTFTYEGTATGMYRVDISSPQTSGPPLPVTKTTLPAQGPWQLEVPKNLGPIVIVAFIEEGHGPGGTTPTTTVYGLTVGETPLTDVALVPVAGGSVVGTPPEAPPGGEGQPQGTDPNAAPVAATPTRPPVAATPMPPPEWHRPLQAAQPRRAPGATPLPQRATPLPLPPPRRSTRQRRRPTSSARDTRVRGGTPAWPPLIGEPTAGSPW